MKNQKHIMLIAIISIVAVSGVSIFAISRNDSDKMHDSIMSSHSTQESSNITLVDKNSMDYKMYSKLSGDEYDRLFVANMIEHHKGAIDMANLALQNAQHQELKDMANDIINTQSKEIADMQSWQKLWGYPVSSGEMMMDHSAMGMSHDMDVITQSLNGLSGDEFDKAFLASMIEHHLSAINMSAPGTNNAKHHELKDLTTAIILSQSNEIKQMRQWQKEWGY